MAKTFFIRTFGCQMNFADSERIRARLKKEGWREVVRRQDADLIIINSCVVRESAENRVYGLINEIRKSGRKPKIILTGCLAGWARRDQTGRNLRQLRRRIGDDVEIKLIDQFAGLETKPQRQAHADGYAYVPISNGCNNFCSYCIVPFSRGREVSRPAKAILREVQCLLRRGHSKIMLLGQNVNSWWGRGRIKTFAQLLEAVATMEGLKDTTFLSANPWDFSNDLINVIAKNKNISRSVHLPLQSGDDEILRKMKRNYTAADYLNLVTKIKKAIPDVKLTTDIIVGFPGETEKAFENTRKVCRAVGFEKAFVSRYSPRPGTLSVKLYPDDVPPAEKKRRWRILNGMINLKLGT